MRVDGNRVCRITGGEPHAGPVIYWMSRDQRAHNNWALTYAQDLASESDSALIVAFCLVPQFLGAALRQYGFMLRGLRETSNELEKKNIGFALLRGDPATEIPRFAREIKAGAVVTDFDPLRIKIDWQQKVAKKLEVPFYEVDAHNIVPCRIASPKREYAARTFRPKINKLLPGFIEGLPNIKTHPANPPSGFDGMADADSLLKELNVDDSVNEVQWLTPGRAAGRRKLRAFTDRGLIGYAQNSRDPNADSQSDLSPYLHFGQLSAQAVALEIRKASAPDDDKEAFLEQLIVRRELSDNFCFYTQNYDSTDAFPSWALETLDKHSSDSREYTYEMQALENAQTHDRLWNAAQKQMVNAGKMHGYMRMYWAKKILEWTESPAEALEIVVSLNDKYELDGRDSNGYVGAAWAIGGVHDRPWIERPVFGKIRYMNYNGCRSKFDIERYVEQNK